MLDIWQPQILPQQKYNAGESGIYCILLRYVTSNYTNLHSRIGKIYKMMKSCCSLVQYTNNFTYFNSGYLMISNMLKKDPVIPSNISISRTTPVIILLVSLKGSTQSSPLNKINNRIKYSIVSLYIY